jgi:hypothetical protein
MNATPMPSVGGASLSRRLARFAAELHYDALPPAVIDKAKALLLHGVLTALLGAHYPAARRTTQLMKDEEQVARGGSSLIGDGTRVTKCGAAYANSEMMHITGQSDSYRMLTHPGLTVLPAALVLGESEHASGAQLISAIVAGYEVQERLSGDVLPSTQARGFRSSPIYGVFGAAVTAARLMGLDEDHLNSAIALAVNFAAGNLEGARSGGLDTGMHEPSAARNGVFAALLARDGVKGGETTLEGEAGFYHGYAGSHDGRLTYAFDARDRTDLWQAAEGFGERWEILATIHKIYSTSGYNQPHVELAARLAADNRIDPGDIAGIDLEVNWLETLYPSPAFPEVGKTAKRGGTAYFCAYGLACGGYPVIGRPQAALAGLDGPPPPDPPSVLALIPLTRVTPSKERPLMTPRITVHLRDGRALTAEATGREFAWDLAEERRRCRDLLPGLPIPAAQADDLIDLVSQLEKSAAGAAERILRLTLVNAS